MSSGGSFLSFGFCCLVSNADLYEEIMLFMFWDQGVRLVFYGKKVAFLGRMV